MIQIVHLDYKNFINRYRIFDKEESCFIESFMWKGLLDKDTHKIEMLKVKGQNVTGELSPKVTENRKPKQTTNKKKRTK